MTRVELGSADRSRADHRARAQNALVPDRAGRDHRHRHHHRRRAPSSPDSTAPSPTSSAASEPTPPSFSNFPIGLQRRHPRRCCGANRITYEDGVAIAARCPSVHYVSPYLIPNSFGTGPQINIARYKGNELYNARLGGTEESYAEADKPRCRKAVSSPTSKISTTCRWP